ncbi:hypothetical protein NI17_006970 [Thermobifida halotolerans]|uniref:Uncharacterized protein n=1 Tax=Thermobifida halotolerans TaxID=483545 RepID=A0A399GA50_9ACTN|nr:hypothetical protein [Thermobifida halotolerans]UOE20909.1 hypothetical protein NI17_006970 [Thermobifida halotolerans]
MATYRLRLRDGSTVTHRALRIRTDATTLYLEDRAAGAWRPVVDYRLDDVERLQRRFVENNGSWVWMEERLSVSRTGHRPWRDSAPPNPSGQVG